MKAILFVSVLFIFILTPAYGQSLSDTTGLINRLDVKTGGHSFDIKVTSNFDISNFEFDKDEKKLTLYITSSLENNLGEILVPLNFLSGNLTFFVNDQQYFPKISTNEKISFVTLNFTGSGDNKLELFGTTYLSGLVDRSDINASIGNTLQKKNTFDDSFNWIIMVGSLIVVTGFIIMKFKKKKLN